MNAQNETPAEEMAIAELDLTFNPEVFDPNKDQLHAIAAEVAKIEADPGKMTKDTLELINTTKNKLVKARTRIQKIGKAQREPATKYAKEVKAYEDELLAILAPEEDRMKTLEKAAKEHAMREERMKTLPEYIEKLQSIGDPGLFAEGSAITEDFLLTLDPNQRDQFYNERLSAKLEADKAEIEAKKREQEEAERRAREIKEAEERAKEEERQRLAREAAEQEAKRQAEQEAERKAKEEAERKAREEEEERKASEAYQKWLSDHQYDEATDKLIDVGDEMVLYRKIASYKK